MKKMTVLKSKVLLLLLLSFIFTNCGSKSSEDEKNASMQTQSSSKPLNISILLDLSDRLTQTSDGMSQMDKDLELVGCIRDIVLEDVQDKKIVNADACLKIYFYPSPKIENINKIANSLDYDFGLYKKSEKKQLALQMRDSLISSLSSVYNETLSTKDWVGSDIYGFMQTKANNYCVKKGYRNILIVLTDGYIYHENNWSKEGTQYKGITPISLKAGQTGIISSGVKIPDLEVLFLEINSPQANDVQKIKSMITDWLKDMDINNCQVISTDLPSNTHNIISNFIK